MGKLLKYTLGYDEKKEKWVLENDKTDRIIKTFNTKEQAIAGGVLKRALGGDGGSVKIKKLDSKFQEERTFPRSKDPRKSKG